MFVVKRFDVDYLKTGAVEDDAQVSTTIDGVNGLTDIVVLSHGWNETRRDASSWYDQLLSNLDRLVSADLAPELLERQAAAIGLFWPSQRFDDDQLAAAAHASGGSDEALLRALDRLQHDPMRLGGADNNDVHQVHVESAKALVPELESSAVARREFVASIRVILDPGDRHPEDGSTEFLTLSAETLFANFAGPVMPVGSAQAGLFGDLFTGTKAAARRIVNYACYYQMKSRAGTVGRTGVALLLARILERHPDVGVHLVGHSFGGRLIASAASVLSSRTPAKTMMLLQAAFSHNAFAVKFDGTNDGAFRTVLADRRVSGPVLITHTKNDKAVGVAYPLASRISGDVASALGDENDPYGGLGRNGALHTPAAFRGTLQDVGGPYAFAEGHVYNLKADAFVKSHSDVTNPQVAYALVRAIV